MPSIGNHVDAIFLPESVNTSTTLRINGGDLHLDDNKKILLGQSDDLQIYHDGNHSYIDDAGTGNLYIRSGTLPIQNLAGTKTSATFNSGAGQELRFDNDIKFVTTATGIDVTGLTDTDTLNVSSTSTFQGNVHLLDDDRLQIGGSAGTVDGLEIYHDGSDSYINDTGTGALQVRTSALVLRSNVGENMAFVYSNGAVQLYHNNSKKFETTTTGIDVTGNDIKLLGPTSGSTFTTSTLTLRGFRQSAAGQFGNIDFSNIDANSANTEYLAARISGQLGGGVNGGELKFFVTPDNSTTLNSTAVLILHEDSSGEFSSDLTIGGNLTVNGTTTTINSTTLTVDDKNIVLASGAADSAAANDAGITIDGANESLTWADNNKSFKFSTRLAIGSSTTQSATLRLSKDVGGENATTYYAFLNNGLVQPDVTGTAYYSLVQVRTDGNNGTGYTISNLEGYSASVGSGTIHADTTITDLVGFNVKNTWIEGTNNYAFKGNINEAANTNRWNIYMDGSAPNYFAGNVGIGTDNPAKILHISGTSTVQEIRYGHNAAGYFLSNTEVNRSGSNQAIHNYHYRWNGTKVAQMSVLTGDDAVNKDDGYFTFETASAGTTAERLRITADGNVGISTATPAEKLHVTGSILLEHGAPFIKFAETGLTGSPEFWAGMDAGNFSIRLDNSAPYPFRIHTKGANNDSIDFISFGGETSQDVVRITSASGAATYLDVKSSADNLNSRIRFFENTTEKWNFGYNTSNNRMDLTQGASQTVLSLTDTHNVGINRPNPTESLDVNGVAMASLLVDSVYASETWPAGNNTLAGNDLGTWTLTDGILDTPTSGADDYHMVDTANLPHGLNAITWVGNNAISYLTSPNINITNLRTNTGIFGNVSDYSSSDRTIADSRIYLTALLAAQSMDTAAEYMEVQLSSDGGTTWVPDIAFVSQDSDTDPDDITDTYWRKVVIDISEYSSSTFQIRFKGTGVGAGDGYGVSNNYIHEAPIPNRLQAKTLKLGDGKITNSTYEHSNALTLVASGGTSKLIVLEDDGNLRQNYIGINNSDNLEIAADEDNAGDDSRIHFRIDGKKRMQFYTSTDANASQAHLQLIGHATPTDRSNWRITARDDGTHGYFTISDFSGGAWTTNLTVHEGGNVGIGTTDPAEKLEVVGHVKIDSGPVLGKASSVSGDPQALRITSSTGWVEVGSQNASYAHFYTDRDRFYFHKKLIVDEGIISAYNENLKLATGNSGENVHLTILSANGNVGIGIEAPTQKLHVAGNALIGDGTDISPTSVGVGHITINANGYTPYITADATAMYVGHNSSARQLRFQTNESTRMYIRADGSNVGIGTTHHSSYALSLRNITTPSTTGG